MATPEASRRRFRSASAAAAGFSLPGFRLTEFFFFLNIWPSSFLLFLLLFLLLLLLPFCCCCCCCCCCRQIRWNLRWNSVQLGNEILWKLNIEAVEHRMELPSFYRVFFCCCWFRFASGVARRRTSANPFKVERRRSSSSSRVSLLFSRPFFLFFSSVEKKNNSVKLPIHNEKLGKNPVMGRPLRGDSPENNGKSNSMEI